MLEMWKNKEKMLFPVPSTQWMQIWSRDLPGEFGSCSLGEVALQVYGSKLELCPMKCKCLSLEPGPSKH